MAAIRSKDTKPELLLRSKLHRAGFRFRLHSKLPGKPDLALRRYRAVIFVHGCFWHAHGCPRSRQPDGEYWSRKLARNVERDAQVAEALHGMGWRRLVVWECSMIGRGRIGVDAVTDRVASWLASGDEAGEIGGVFPVE